MKLAQQLVDRGHLCTSQYTHAQRIQKQKGGNLLDIIVELGFVEAKIVIDAVAEQAQTSRVHLKTLQLDPSVTRVLPYETALRFKAIPIEVKNQTLKVALANPMDLLAIDTIGQLTGYIIDVCVAGEKEILEHLDEHYRVHKGVEETIDRALEEASSQGRVPLIDHMALDLSHADQDEAPVIQLVSKILTNAVRAGASDIHFEPDENVMRIRSRVDGAMRQDVLIPKSMQSSVITRVKILAELDVTENRLPQDGRASLRFQQRHISLRVSSLPTSFGENVVIRILDPDATVKDFSDMGMLEDTQEELLEMASQPNGVLIITGPTGSGKSTTLYALLRRISNLETSVFTLEDPIEYRMSLVRQTQINEDIGLTFSRGLRSLLRQDPDVILVGETRDQETAQLMIRAALTGHLVFTTLHTNDAAGAIPRLIDMGVEPFLLPASLIGVGAQRLVRKLCPNCVHPQEKTDSSLQGLSHLLPEKRDHLTLGDSLDWTSKGCETCHQSGYKGRVGVFELLRVNEAYHDAILQKSPSQEIQNLARKQKMRTMLEDGLIKASWGQTSLKELFKVVQP